MITSIFELNARVICGADHAFVVSHSGRESHWMSSGRAPIGEVKLPIVAFQYLTLPLRD